MNQLANAQASPRYRRPLRRRSTRRAAVTLEFILVMPILFIALLASFQYGIAVLINNAISHAAVAGVRKAAEVGAVDSDIKDAVNGVLVVHGLSIDAIPSDSEVSIVIERDGTSTTMCGNLTCSAPTSAAIGTDEVRVTVCVSMTAAPFLNVLTDYGIDFTGKRLVASSFAELE